MSFPSCTPQVSPDSLETSPARRLAVFHQGALGDFLLACPVFEGLHRALPQAVLDFWTRENHAKLIASRPYFGRFHPPDSADLGPFYHDDHWSRCHVPAPLREAERVLVFGQAGAGRLAERLSLRLRRPVHWIQSFPREDSPMPVTEFLAQQVSDEMVRVEPVHVVLNVEREERRRAEAWLAASLGSPESKPLFVHPGSGGVRKIWPLARWWGLIGWLRKELNMPVVLTLGPADGKLEDFARESETLGVLVARGLSLGGLTALLSNARFFVGSDSGVSHLAGALAIPGLAVFGHSDPRVWAPWGGSVRVVVEQWSESEVFRWSPEDGEALEATAHVRSLLSNFMEEERAGEVLSQEFAGEMKDR